MNKKTEYWLTLAKYDYKTAKLMLKGRRYLYVGFMCHQVLEKSIKAIYVVNKKIYTPIFPQLGLSCQGKRHI